MEEFKYYRAAYISDIDGSESGEIFIEKDYDSALQFAGSPENTAAKHRYLHHVTEKNSFQDILYCDQD